MSPGSEEHLRFITLTVAIDYQRPADQLSDAARATYRDEQTRYLFNPIAVANTGPLQVSRDMQRHRLSKKQDKDARIWQTICTTLASRYTGHVEALLQEARCGSGCCTTTAGCSSTASLRLVCRWMSTPPRRRCRSAPYIHLATAAPWALAGEPDIYPLRLDEPLWLLSKYGCRKTRTWPCEFQGDCPVGSYCEHARPWFDANVSEINDSSECTIELLNSSAKPVEHVAAVDFSSRRKPPRSSR